LLSLYFAFPCFLFPFPFPFKKGELCLLKRELCFLKKGFMLFKKGIKLFKTEVYASIPSAQYKLISQLPK
jgi:hypothetical protein